MPMKIHTQSFDEKHVIIASEDLQALVEAASKTVDVEVESDSSDEMPFSVDDLMRLSERGGSLDFLLDEREDIYTVDDLKVRY
ncbi:MAG: hypothetical protein L0229_00745 [Blastocatellia bacterium]|nr:hypothetical protein [Blastocatellia bacterium]